MHNGIIINHRNTFYFIGQANTTSSRLSSWRWWTSPISPKSLMKSTSTRRDPSSQYSESCPWWCRTRSQPGSEQVHTSTKGRSLYLGGSTRGRRTIWSCSMILWPLTWGHSSRLGRQSCWYRIWSSRCTGGSISSKGWRRREGRIPSSGRGWSSSSMIRMSSTARIRFSMRRAWSRLLWSADTVKISSVPTHCLHTSITSSGSSEDHVPSSISNAR